MSFAVESKTPTELFARRFDICGALPWLCRLDTDLSPRFSFRSVFWDLWWITWHWGSFSSHHFDFTLSCLCTNAPYSFTVRHWRYDHLSN
jgi:hypothetical protein